MDSQSNSSANIKKVRLNKSGDRRGIHDNHRVPKLPKISEEEEGRFLDQDLDRSLRTKKFRFNLQGHNVRNFINAVIKSPLVQDLLSEEFLAGKEPQNQDESVADSEEHLVKNKSERCEKTQRLTRSRKRKLPREEIESTDPFLALLEQNETKEREQNDSNENFLGFPWEDDTADQDDDDDYIPNVDGFLGFSPDFNGSSSGKVAGGLETAETIASRTRKRLNLESERIEDFELPQSFTEVEELGDLERQGQEQTDDQRYTASTPGSVSDYEELTWRNWLKGLMNEGEVEHVSSESDHEDSDPDFDYNLCFYKTGFNEEKLERSKKEFEIPQEEKEQLVKEALNYLGITKTVDLPEICKTIVLPKILRSKPVKKRRRYDDTLTLELLHKTLKQQFQMYVQLLTQNFLFCMTLNNWSHAADVCKKAVLDLKYSGDDLFGHFKVFNLDMAARIVDYPHSFELRQRSSVLPNQLLRILLHSEVFMYRELLPYYFVRPKRASPSKNEARQWLDAEDCAIALGVFDLAFLPGKGGRLMFSMSKICQFIHQNLLPTRDPKRILRRYYMLLGSSDPNPVAYLDKHRTLPVLPQDVSWVEDPDAVPPVALDPDDKTWPLPMWMQILKYLDQDKEPDFEETCEKSLVAFSDKLRAKYLPIEEESLGSVVKSIRENYYGSLIQAMDDENRNDETVGNDRLESEDEPELISPEIKSKSSHILTPKKYQKSPAKVLSDKLVKRAIKTSIGNSPRKIIKFTSPSKTSKSIPGSFKRFLNRGNIQKSENCVIKDLSSVGGFRNSFDLSCKTVAQKRVVKRRKNWQQSKKTLASVVAYFRQTQNPESTPELESRIQSMREEIFSNIYDCMGAETFDLFLSVLSQLDIRECSSKEKVLQIKELFADYNCLYKQLAKVVDVETSLVLGLYFEFRAFERAKLFLQKVEVCTRENPKLFNVILDTFASSSLDETSIWNNVTPLLEFNPLLIDEFSLFFKNQTIPDTFRGPFEEIIVTEGDSNKIANENYVVTNNKDDGSAQSQSEESNNLSEAIGKPVFEEYVLLDDDDEKMVRERSARKLEKKAVKNNSQKNYLSNCIVRDIMQAKVEQLTEGKVSAWSSTSKKLKRPTTPNPVQT